MVRQGFAKPSLSITWAKVALAVRALREIYLSVGTCMLMSHRVILLCIERVCLRERHDRDADRRLHSCMHLGKEPVRYKPM